MKAKLFIPVLMAGAMLAFASCKKEDPNAPRACMDLPGEIHAGSPATFNGSCSENAVSFFWEFGDGGTSTQENPTHTYAEEGSYPVVLTVANAEGLADETTATVTVLPSTIIEHKGDITSDETWGEGEHHITGDVYVDNCILTIAPGAVIKFSSGYGLYIGYRSGSTGSTLIANGTSGMPITFTSAATIKSAGDWDYIGFYGGASNANSMQYCNVEYGGGYNENTGMLYVDGSAVGISNSSFTNSEAIGISLQSDAWFTTFENNTINLVGGAAIQIYGNWAHTIGTGNTLMSVQGIAVKADDMEQADVTWLKQTTAYVLAGDLYVGASTGATLNIDPGVEIRMGDGIGIYMGYRTGTFGTIIAEGTAGDRIRFTSAAPDVAKSPGDWDFIGFYEGAGTNSSFDYCDFEYGGGYSSNYGMLYAQESGFSLTNSTVMNSMYYGISFGTDAGFGTCTGNSFADNGTQPIHIGANYAHTIGAGNQFAEGTGIEVDGEDLVQSNVTWLKQNVPYICDGDIYLGSTSGSTLTIEAGSSLKFTGGSGLLVGYRTSTFGVLVADGEVGNGITFTSAAPAGAESPGDWDGIWFEDGTGNGSLLDNCRISYGGGYSNNSGNVIVRDAPAGLPVISNCQIENSEAYGIYIYNSSPTLTDNIFGNNALGDTN